MSKVKQLLPAYGTETSRYWRSLDELRGASVVSERDSATELTEAAGLDRRELVKYLGVSFAHGGTDCLHAPADREDRAVRATAGGDRSGQAALFCDGDVSERLRHGAPRRKPYGPPHEGGRQSTPSGEPGRDRHVQPGRALRPLRSRPLPEHHLSGRDPGVAGIPFHHAPCPGEGAREERARAAHPDRNGRFADARSSARHTDPRPSRGALASVGAGQPRRGMGRRDGRVRPAGRNGSPPRSRRRNPFARRGLSRLRPGAPAVSPRVFRAAPAQRPAEIQPSLRRRVHAERDGSLRGSPPARARVGGRSVCAVGRRARRRGLRCASAERFREGGRGGLEEPSRAGASWSRETISPPPSTHLPMRSMRRSPTSDRPSSRPIPFPCAPSHRSIR